MWYSMFKPHAGKQINRNYIHQIITWDITMLFESLLTSTKFLSCTVSSAVWQSWWFLFKFWPFPKVCSDIKSNSNNSCKIGKEQLQYLVNKKCKSYSCAVRKKNQFWSVVCWLKSLDFLCMVVRTVCKGHCLWPALHKPFTEV